MNCKRYNFYDIHTNLLIFSHALKQADLSQDEIEFLMEELECVKRVLRDKKQNLMHA